MAENSEIVFQNSIESVAPKVIGRDWVSPLDFSHTFLKSSTFIDQYLTSFRDIMKAGYEAGRDDLSFSYKVIGELRKNVNEHAGARHATESVPWMIAFAIVNKDDSIKGLSDTRLRLIFDLGIGIVVEDNHRRYVATEMHTAYETDPKKREDFGEFSRTWKGTEDYWKNLQNLLREQATPGSKEIK